MAFANLVVNRVKALHSIHVGCDGMIEADWAVVRKEILSVLN